MNNDKDIIPNSDNKVKKLECGIDQPSPPFFKVSENMEEYQAWENGYEAGHKDGYDIALADLFNLLEIGYDGHEAYVKMSLEFEESLNA